MKVAVPLWVIILAGLVLLAFVVILWSVKRRRRAHLSLLTDDRIEELIPSIAGLTQGTIVGGNAIELLQNGAFWDPLFRDLAAAKTSINYETFLAKEGELTRRMADVLSRKAREGVEVRVLLDGSGGRNFGKEAVESMRAAGVNVQFYHRLTFRNLGVLNNRDHRKIALIDGRIGYIGGHCLVDTWLGDADDKKHFRDISARVEGPAVAQLMSAFAENWIEECGEVPGGEQFFPEPVSAGDMKAHVVWTSPTGSPSTVKLLHYMVIHAAKKSIAIQNPYFLPDPDARDALVDAVKRGVEVRIMIPDAKVTDSPIAQHASHHHYGTLMKGGVRLFDYQRTLLHQKVIVIDGVWAAVGSTNFDDRSFEVNDEATLSVYDSRIAEELLRIFEEDLQHSRERKLEEWRKRGSLHKLTDFCAFLFNEQL